MRARIPTTLLVALTSLPVALSAQGVVVQSASDLRFFGALGTVVGLAAKFGGANIHDIQSTTSVAGHKMRVESENTATIIDADAGRFTQLDRKQKTYTSVTFDEMAAAMQQAAQSAGQDAQKQKVEAAKDPKAPKGDVNFKYKVATDRPGQHETIAGYDAERLFLTITIEAEATPEGEKTQQAGSLILLLDLWRSKDAPQIAAMEEFQRAYAQKVGQTFRPPVEALQAAFSSDPRIKEGFEASAKELQKVSGVALRSTTYVVGVPVGMTFDRQLALTGAAAATAADNGAKKDEQPKSGGFRGLMGAIKSAADQANKSSASNDKNAPPPVKQGTLLTMTEEVKSITRGSVPAETFEAPAGYREIKRPTAPK